jgi:hypothetical protein
MSELPNMAMGARQDTLLELNCFQSSSGIGSRGRTAVFVACGYALCCARELGAVLKLALELAIVVKLTVNFSGVHRTGGRGSFVAGRIRVKLRLHQWCKHCKVPVLLP